MPQSLQISSSMCEYATSNSFSWLNYDASYDIRQLVFVDYVPISVKHNDITSV